MRQGQTAHLSRVHGGGQTALKTYDSTRCRYQLLVLRDEVLVIVGVLSRGAGRCSPLHRGVFVSDFRPNAGVDGVGYGQRAIGRHRAGYYDRVGTRAGPGSTAEAVQCRRREYDERWEQGAKLERNNSCASYGLKRLDCLVPEQTAEFGGVVVADDADDLAVHDPEDRHLLGKHLLAQAR
jgi:hypothetical protein